MINDDFVYYYYLKNHELGNYKIKPVCYPNIDFKKIVDTIEYISQLVEFQLKS